MLLLTVWCLLLIFIFSSVHFELFSERYNFLVSWLIIALMLLFLIWPFHCLYLTLRKSILLTLINNLFPFGKKFIDSLGKTAVKFRDFMFGDMLTSLTRPFQNLYFTVCYSFCSNCVLESDYSSSCTRTDITPLILTLVPYFIRLFQCINRFYYTGNGWPHMANAFKYLSGLTNSFLLWDIDSLNNNNIVISFGIICSIYMIYWDIVMDWGLGHFKSKNFFLRDKLMYPKRFYYWTLVSNFVLRFTWLINIYIRTSTLFAYQMKFFIWSFLEIFRRIQWSLFRVENENQNNFEKYRAILDIPELPSH